MSNGTGEFLLVCDSSYTTTTSCATFHGNREGERKWLHLPKPRQYVSHLILALYPIVDWEIELEMATKTFYFYSPQCWIFKGAICDFHQCQIYGNKKFACGGSSGLLGWSVTSHITLSVDTEPFLSSCSLAYACVFVHVNLCLLPLMWSRNIIKNEKRPALPQANAPHLQKSHANSTKTCCK